MATSSKAKKSTAEVMENEPIPAALSPKEYFDLLKGKRETVTEEQIQKLHDSAMKLMQKYIVTGQKSGAQKLYNFVQLCEREIGAVKEGIDTYIERKDVDEYIANIADASVFIIELSEFERDIPDALVDKIATLQEKAIFDQYYVIFTDYTKEHQKKVEKARREKDPILVGAMLIGNQINSRLYYIGDWVDDYCDLTLDKMVEDFAKKEKPDPKKSLNLSDVYATPDDLKRAIEKRYKKVEQAR